MGNEPSVVREGSGGPSSFGDFYTVLSVEKDATSDQIRVGLLCFSLTAVLISRRKHI